MKNYQEIKQDIINQILNEKSTSALSKRMGYNFDKVSRWQNGTKQLRWDEFCLLCKHTHVPLGPTLKELGLHISKQSDCLNAVSNFRNFFPEISSKDLAASLDVNVSSLNRYIRTESYPDFEFILRLIDMREDTLSVFQSSLLRKKDDAALSFIKYPWMPAVANSMLIKKYQELPEHSSKWLSNFLGISIYEVELAITEMMKIGIIQKIGPHFSRGEVIKGTVLIAGIESRIELNNKIAYWTKFIYKKLTSTPVKIVADEVNNDRCFIRVFSCGPKNSKRVSEIIALAEKDIHDYLQQNREPETDDVRVVLLHHFSAGIVPVKSNSIY